MTKLLQAHYEDIINGKLRKVPWPWSYLTQMCPSLLPGSVTVIAGAPGASKSFMMLQCLEFWIRRGVNVAYMMLEGSRDSFMRRCVSQLTGNPNHMDFDWIEQNSGKALSDVQSFTEELKQISQAIVDGTLLYDPNYTDVKMFLDQECDNGARVLMVDPITSADGQGQPWTVDKEMILFCQGIAKKHGASVILVTHPAKNGQLKVVPTLDALAGGTAFQRHVDAVLWLEKIDAKVLKCVGPCGTSEIKCDRRMHLLKVRDGRGQGMILGYRFEPDSLLLAEQGIIVKE